MGNRVKRVRTEVSESQMAQAITEAWTEMFKSPPGKEQISMIMAQNALETNHRKSMWNFNVGNITTDGKGSFNYFDDLETDEQIKPGEWRKMKLKYRAYPSLKDGVKDYLRLLSGKKYSSAWQNILKADPIAFSKSLKNSGYYTGNEAPYTKALSSLYKQFNASKNIEHVPNGNIIPMKGSPQMNQSNKFTELDKVLDEYLKMIAASNKLLYNKVLPNNHYMIEIYGSDLTDKIEFANILSSALDEELLSNSFIYLNDNDIQIECIMTGPHDICVEAITSITELVSEAFKKATIKLGELSFKTNIFTNKTSSYEKISLETAEIQHRKFLLKFV